MTGKEKLQIVGNCPDCGAPIYGNATYEGKKAPKVTYSCECKTTKHYPVIKIIEIEKEYVPQPYPIYVERPAYVPTPIYPTGPLYPTWEINQPSMICGTASTSSDTNDYRNVFI